jgi:hypothetical protein
MTSRQEILYADIERYAKEEFDNIFWSVPKSVYIHMESVSFCKTPRKLALNQPAQNIVVASSSAIFEHPLKIMHLRKEGSTHTYLIEV